MDRKENKTTMKKVFITGLLILIPIAATVFVLIFLFNMLDGWLAPSGGKILRVLGVRLPADLQQIPGFGILATFILIFITGLFASNYLGRKILQFGDTVVKKIPVVNSIYSAMRQVVDSFSVTGAKAFKTVVLFEYPRKGIWAMGFLTTISIKSVQDKVKEKMVNVFLPTTPNPTSGFFLMIPEKDLHVLPISPEAGLKMVATVGLIQTEDKASAELRLAKEINDKKVKKQKKKRTKKTN